MYMYTDREKERDRETKRGRGRKGEGQNTPHRGPVRSSAPMRPERSGTTYISVQGLEFTV